MRNLPESITSDGCEIIPFCEFKAISYLIGLKNILQNALRYGFDRTEFFCAVDKYLADIIVFSNFKGVEFSFRSELILSIEELRRDFKFQSQTTSSYAVQNLHSSICCLIRQYGN